MITNQEIWIPVVAAIVAATAAVISAIIAAIVTRQNTAADLAAARRTERYKYLVDLMRVLQEAFAEYEEFLANHPAYIDPKSEQETEKHARIIGKAIAACYAAGDIPENQEWINIPTSDQLNFNKWADKYQHFLAHIAHARLTKNLVKKPNGSDPAIGRNEMMQIEKWGHYHDRNRHALTDAVLRLSTLIKQLQ